MPVIDVENLIRTYGGVEALDGSLTVEDGEIFGIVGANGASKTTTVEGAASPRWRHLRVLGLDPITTGARSPTGSALDSGRTGSRTR